ncbi:MAG: type II CRISPR-associated endonuclease Cas1 [Ignavibacteria bacterium]|nr:type II CRISPR-associated endonuclease Cas1 [Ignavibacteria bacterium]
MIKRSIIIASQSFISTKDEQLIIVNRESGEEKAIPIEDIGFLELASTQATITSASLAKLAQCGIPAIICDSSNYPISISTPIYGNTLHNERLRLQIEASKPTLKRVWQALIIAKIRNQADVVEYLGGTGKTLRRYAETVLSDDSSNRESSAARQYWQQVLTQFDVIRDPDGAFPNNFLNYGYAVLRSSVARGLVGAGFHPAIGIKHKNRYNAFALADDVMEPYRPFVDSHVIPYCKNIDKGESLTPTHKKHIVSVLTIDSYHSDGRRPLMNSIELTCARIVKAFQGDIKVLDLPRPFA